MALFLFDVKVLVKPPTMDELQTDVSVADAPSSPPQGETVSSTVDVETSDNSQASVTGSEVQPDVQDDPLKDIPDIETLKQQVEQRVPGAAGMLNLRSAYEAHKLETEPLKALEPWKPITEHFSSVDEVLAQRDLIQKIHSPVIDPISNQAKSGEFTTVPFIQDLEAQSPGTSDRMFRDLLTFQVNGENGQKDTLVRHLVRSWGLDPDRIDDYKEIDKLAPAGVITQDQLRGIDPKFHAAFKALTSAQREDILSMGQRDDYGQVTYPSTTLDYLQDKTEALEARQWREQENQRQQQEAQAKQREFEQATNKAVDEDISTVRREMYDSIHQNLASQLKLSSDDLANDSKYDLVMGTLGSLFYPEFRFAAEKALQRAGMPVDPKFDETVSAFLGAREKYVRFTRQGDQLQARGALSEANLAKAILNTKLGDYALALSGQAANRSQAQSRELQTSLQGATARVIPSGTTQQTSGSNPYMENPHPFGSSEYMAYNKRLDRELGVGGAAALGR
jgi:hypothetical protein